MKKIHFYKKQGGNCRKTKGSLLLYVFGNSYFMAVMDEFKEEREHMKQQPLKKRLEYFWDYHKVHVLVGIFLLMAAYSFIHSILDNKETAFMAALIDCSCIEDSAQAYKEDVAEYMGIDTDTADVVIDTSFHVSGANTAQGSSMEVLMARIVAAELDTLLAREEQFNRYTFSEIFRDLREVLTEEQIAYYQDSFYYIDYAVIESSDMYTSVDADYIDITDHTNPQGMEKPVPIGIYLDFTETFSNTYFFASDEPILLGVLTNAPHPERAGQFLDKITGRAE